MRRCFFRVVVSVSILSSTGLWGCNSSKTPAVAPDTAAPEPVAAQTDPRELIDSKPVAPQPSAVPEVPVLAHGTHMVFGIRLPKGMMPMSTDGKVKRFEGTHSLESVKNYLMGQLAGKVDIRRNNFGPGYFISSAIPASSQRDLNNVDESVRKYNIKIFDGSLGGAGVDIWEAQPGFQHADHTADANGAAIVNSTGTRLLKTRGAASSAPKVKYHTKKQREKATFDVFEKMATGKPLSEADYQSPFFTDM